MKSNVEHGVDHCNRPRRRVSLRRHGALGDLCLPKTPPPPVPGRGRLRHFAVPPEGRLLRNRRRRRRGEACVGSRNLQLGRRLLRRRLRLLLRHRMPRTRAMAKLLLLLHELLHGSRVRRAGAHVPQRLLPHQRPRMRVRLLQRPHHLLPRVRWMLRRHSAGRDWRLERRRISVRVLLDQRARVRWHSLRLSNDRQPQRRTKRRPLCFYHSLRLQLLWMRRGLLLLYSWQWLRMLRLR